MTADRQIRLQRDIAARPETVWRCFADPALLPRWFGPEGYRCDTREIRTGEGGIWRFDMIGPDGRVWPNRHRYFGVIESVRLEYWLDGDDDAEAPIHALVELEPVAAGTRVIMTMTFPTAAACAGARDFGAAELGQTTLAKLARLAEGDLPADHRSRQS